MSTQLDFYFDFGSPTAYLAYMRLKQLQQQYDLEVVYKPRKTARESMVILSYIIIGTIGLALIVI